MLDELVVILGTEVSLLTFIAVMTLRVRRMDVLSGAFFEQSAIPPAGNRPGRDQPGPARLSGMQVFRRDARSAAAALVRAGRLIRGMLVQGHPRSRAANEPGRSAVSHEDAE